MIEKNIINEEELEKVTGGTVTKNINTYSAYNIPVGKYSGVIGTKYLFKGTSGASDDWIFGTLVNTYEHSFWRKRVHDVTVEDGIKAFCRCDGLEGGSSIDYGRNLEIYGDKYQMYRKG